MSARELPRAIVADGGAIAPPRRRFTEADLLAALPLVALAIATGVLAWIYLPLFRGEVCGDDNTFHYAESVRIAAAAKAGDFDWWNPSANGGFATGYYYQAIPAAVPGLLGALFGDTLFWFQLGIFLPLVLVPVCGYRALRILDVEPWPAVGGGIAIAFAVSHSKWGHGADGVFSVGLYTQVVALAVFPLAFAHGVRWITRGDHLGAAIAWGALAGMTHPVAGMALGAALAPVAFIAAIGTALVNLGWSPYPAPPPPSPPRWLDVVAPFGRIALLGLLLLIATAAAWLPTIVDYAGFGGFPHRLPDEAGPGFGGLSQWFTKGWLLDWQRRFLILTALIPAGIVVALADPRGRHLRALLAAALVLAFVVGIGRSLKTEDDLFPAVRFMGALQVVLAMFAGAAFVTMAQVAVRWVDPVQGGVFAQATIGFIVGLVAIGLVAETAGYQRSRVRVAADFPGVHREALPTGAGDPRRRAGPHPEPRRRQPLGHDAAVHPGRPPPPGRLRRRGAAVVAQLRLPVRRCHSARAAWIYDAPIVLCTHQKGGEVGGTLLAQTLTYELRELPAPGLVGPVHVVGVLSPGRKAYREETLRWQNGDEPLQDQVLVHHGDGGEGPPPDGDVDAIVRGSSRISAALDVRAPTTFAIRESWHPRWRATIDGRPAKIRRITPDMMAVDVGPGHHALVLSFERPWWTWASYLLLPIMIVVGWLLSRRKRAIA